MITAAQSKKPVLDELPEILNAEQIACYLGIGYTKALNLIKYGGIPYMKIGNTYRISKQLFKAWLNHPEKREVLTSKEGEENQPWRRRK